MKQILSLLVVAFLSVNTFAQTATTWNADPAHTQVFFNITHLGIADIKGNFGEFESSIVAAKDDFSDAQYAITIQVPSINTGIEMRDDHLRSADFFDAEKHPTMTFKSTSSKKVSDKKYQVTGDLTFHGITKPITLDVTHRGTIDHPQSGKTISGFTISGNVKRSDYKLGPDFPEAVLSNDVKIEVNGEFIKQ